jgi:hypothetical protein
MIINATSGAAAILVTIVALAFHAPVLLIVAALFAAVTVEELVP